MIQRHLVEQCRIDCLADCVETGLNFEPFPDDRQQHIDRHADPDLRLDRVLAVTVKRLDSQVLLDPLEEQLRLPPVLADLRDGQRRQAGVAGQKRQGLVPLAVCILDAPQLARIADGAFFAAERAALAADQAAGAVMGRRAEAEFRILFRAHHETAAAAVQGIEPLIVQAGVVHDANGAGLGQQRFR